MTSDTDPHRKKSKQVPGLSFFRTESGGPRWKWECPNCQESGVFLHRKDSLSELRKHRKQHAKEKKREK